MTFLRPATATINCFQLYTEADRSRIITAAPSKSCDLDPLQTDILRQFLPELQPYMIKMCNASLRDGSLPMSQVTVNVLVNSPAVCVVIITLRAS